MLLTELLSSINIISASAPMETIEAHVGSICQDSRRADENCLFVCKVGAIVDGHKYAAGAYDKGARFFIAEHDIDLPSDAVIFTVKDSSDALRRLSVAFYGNPSAEMRLIGITGTKGKTTVALSVYNIALSCGINMGYIGTNGIFYNGKTLESANTTPDCLEMQKALRMMRDGGVTDVVIEVSSQALWQERTYGLNFEICAFTNLYEDHIGGVEHPDMEHYMRSKRRLFTDYNAKYIIVNSDSPATEFMLEGCSSAKVITTSAGGLECCDLFAKNAEKAKKGVRPGVSFKLYSSEGGENVVDVFIPIPGIYSIENGLLTIAICARFGIDVSSVVSKLSNLSIGGRFEAVELESKPDVLFVIDYAHNGASLTAVLNSLRDYEPKRIIVLFGSVGGRTFGRRAELGRAAEAGADVIIITSDNPDREDPMSVINEIYASIEDKDKEIYLIPDRADAIEKAYKIASEGDFVLLAGKGHESYQLICGEKVAFSERKVLTELDSLSPSYI